MRARFGSTFITLPRIRNTKRLFVCTIAIVFIYVIYLNQILPRKVIKASRFNNKYMIFNVNGIMNFISLKANGALPQTGQPTFNQARLPNHSSTRISTAPQTTIAGKLSIIRSTYKPYNMAQTLKGDVSLPSLVYPPTTRRKPSERLGVTSTVQDMKSSATSKEFDSFPTTRMRTTAIANAHLKKENKTKHEERGIRNESKEDNSNPNKQLLLQMNDADSKVVSVTLTPKVSSSTKQAKYFISSDEFPTNANVLKSDIFGKLNVHLWNDVCETTVESLREFILFPQVPNRRFLVTSFESREAGNNFGQRIFGYLHPPASGRYLFGISSDANSELWLSTDITTRTKAKIASVGLRNESKFTEPGDYFQLPSQISKPVDLRQGKPYFVEVLHKHGTGKSHVEVVWKLPDEKSFQIISGQYISMFVNDSLVKENTVAVDDYWERDVTTLQDSRDFDPYYRLPFIGPMDTADVLHSCLYEPSYYIRRKLVRFQGARDKSNTHFAAVFPPDNTNASVPLMAKEDIWWTENNIGNELLSEKVARAVVLQYMDALELKRPGVYKLQRLVTVELVRDKRNGDRYLLELDLRDTKRSRDVRLSEYVYSPKGSTNLCAPRGFSWDKNVTVNIIVPLKNSGRWALYLIRNVAEIIKQSGNPNVKLIIVDYASSDVDVHALFRKSSIENYAVVTVPAGEEFRRAAALQRGAEKVTDPHSILFLCDLHLKIPSSLIDTIRKHCIEGKMAFAPVVKRLKCGYYPKHPFGYWETLGFGLFAIYKSDFDHVGGMNVDEFKGWGGEDWELLDRVLESQREVERLKIPGFYHFFHPSLNGDNKRLHV